MKQFSLGIFMLLIACSASAQQTNSHNYVISRTFKQSGANPNDISKVVTNVQYIDGMGRPLQNVTVGQSPSGGDFIEPIEFDAAGRQPRKFLPYISNGNGAFQSNAPANAAAWYSANAAGLQPADLGRPFQEKSFESSPLSRETDERAPGNKSATSTIKHKVNVASQVKRYDFDAASNTIIQSGFLAAGTLKHLLVTDEVGNVTNEFTDHLGQTLCRQVVTAAGTLSTYFVYDDLGLLRGVLQPAYQDAPSLTDNAFTYDYDERGRMIVKHVPGGGMIEYIYDQYDRQVLSRDANQQARGVWGFVKYDALDRPVVTGEITSAATRSNWSALVDANTEHHEERNNGATAGYTLDKTAPKSAGEANLLTIIFYDDYGFSKAGNLSYNGTYYPSCNSNAKGQITGGRVRMLPGSGAAGSWLTNVIYYDAEYRPIQKTRELYDLGAGSIERISSQYKYDLAPVISEQKTEHLLAGNTTNTHLATFTYDHADRLLSTKEKINNGGATKEATTLAQRYNALGEPASKWYHSTDGGKFMLRTDYTRNIRGWLTDGKTVHKKDANGADLPYFGFGLAYANGNNYSNGNVTQMQWFNKGEAAFTNGLSLSYDGADRLTGATGLMGYTDTENGITYDKNGNLKTLVRTGVVSDNLNYAYTGNRLSSVTDASGNNLGVKNGISNYSYDANGNMTADGNRNAALTYNYLNLPKTIAVGGKTLTYDYDAAGSKHKYVSDTLTIKYAGRFEYRQVAAGSVLYRVEISEGQAVFRNNVLRFEYSLKDHLGNVRVVFDENKQVLQRTDYYPFGLSINRDGAMPKVQNWVNRYLYNGKELQVGSGYLDYGSRMYMPEIGRWREADKRAEKYTFSSPYSYCLNNPLLYNDPTGDTVRIYTETSVAGHAWLSTGEGKNMTVYTYGRYEGTYPEWHQINTLANGPGILLRLTGKDATAYNQEKFDKTGATIFQVLDVTDDTVQSKMDAQFNSSDKSPEKGDYKNDPRARKVGDYKLLSNNCTTYVCDALNNSGSSATQQRPNKSGKQENDRFVVPASLQSFLNWQANSFFGNHSVKVQQVISPKPEDKQ